MTFIIAAFVQYIPLSCINCLRRLPLANGTHCYIYNRGSYMLSAHRANELAAFVWYLNGHIHSQVLSLVDLVM